MTCGLTTLQATGRNLCKKWTMRGNELESTQYDNVKTVNLKSILVRDLDHLAEIIATLQEHRDACIVRGQVIDPDRQWQVRRLMHDDPKTGDRATLYEVPRMWVALDIDSAPVDETLDLADLTVASAAAMQYVPAEFHGVRHIVQATASHCLKPGLRVRLWYWLSAPVGTWDLTQWFDDYVFVDAAAFRAAQPIYTAPPVFKGLRDPLKERYKMIEGKPFVVVPTFPERVARAGDGTFKLIHPQVALGRAVAKLGPYRVPMESSRHRALVRAAVSLAPYVTAGLLRPEDIHEEFRRVMTDMQVPFENWKEIFTWAVNSSRASVVPLPPPAAESTT